MIRRLAMLVLIFMLLAVGMLWSRGGKPATTVPGDGEELVQRAPVRMILEDRNNKGAAPDNPKVMELVEKLSGVKIAPEFIPGDAYMNKIQLIIASGEAFDLMRPGPEPWPDLKAKGVIQPLNELLDKYAPAYKKLASNTGKIGAPPSAWPYVSDGEGKIWAFPNIGCITRSPCISVRTDWLERLGMEFPTAVGGEPRMSFADYEAYLDAVLRGDPNQNGRTDDEFPLVPYREMTHIYNMLNILQPFFTGFSGMRYLDEKGNVMPAETHPAYKAMLEKVREWYEKGYLHKEFFVLKKAQVDDLVISDRVGSSMGWDSDHIRSMVALREKNPEAYHTIIPPLTGPPGGVSAYVPQVAYGASTYLSATAENPEFALKYFDWAAASLDNTALIWKGIEGEHFRWVDKANLTIETIGDTSRYQNAYQMVVALWPCQYWITEVASQDPVRVEANLNENVKEPSYTFLRPFDEPVVYTTQGTPAEFITGDGKTKLDETKIKVIIGELDMADWDREIESYMQIEGNVLVEIWTKQYDEQT